VKENKACLAGEERTILNTERKNERKSRLSRLLADGKRQFAAGKTKGFYPQPGVRFFSIVEIFNI